MEMELQLLFYGDFREETITGVMGVAGYQQVANQ